MAANYQHLRAFHAIAAEGGVTRAARRLNVSQPTLSQQLKALEQRHGVSLFDGRKAPLKLTLAGRDLYALTQQLFAAAADIDDLLGGPERLCGGQLRLGSDAPAHVVRMLELVRRRHPQVGVQVRLGNAREVIRWLSNSEIDAALASDPPIEGAFAYDPLFCDGLSCALPAGHPLARADRVSVAALARETLILREPTSKTRAYAERALADAGVTPGDVLEVQGREAIREAVALGLGLSVFFTSECPPDPRIAYRPLNTGAHVYALRSYLVRPLDRSRSPLMRALQAIAVDMHQPEG